MGMATAPWMRGSGSPAWMACVSMRRKLFAMRPLVRRAGARVNAGWRGCYTAPVNFVLHHHLAARDLGSPAAGAGAMLPDLWRMADRRVRAAAAISIEDDDVVLAGV